MSTPTHMHDELSIKEPLGGIVLFIATIAAIVVVNSPLNDFYQNWLNTSLIIQHGDHGLNKPVLEWINDGLMAIFFLMVGLEIKREIMEGNFSDIKLILLPFFGALGGVVVPALIFIPFNFHDGISIRGWGIPVATDTAFALGILALLGKRIPLSLKLFLTALAILDDIAGIGIMAMFYTAELSLDAAILASIAILGLILLNYFNVKRLTPYALIGIALWVFVLKSGIHATLAGAVLAFAIPCKTKMPHLNQSPLYILEEALIPWVKFLVLPIFAFANAGIRFDMLSINDVFNSLSIGIILGLFLGKQFGILGTCWLLTKCGLTKLSEDMTWKNLYGVALLCGIGFTMSLFIGSLAFDELDPIYTHRLKVAVLIASILSGVSGYLVLKHSSTIKN